MTSRARAGFPQRLRALSWLALVIAGVLAQGAGAAVPGPPDPTTLHACVSTTGAVKVLYAPAAATGSTSFGSATKKCSSLSGAFLGSKPLNVAVAGKAGPAG